MTAKVKPRDKGAGGRSGILNPKPDRAAAGKPLGSIDAKYIDVLDGIRAISVIIVLIFHFWQQTWIFPTVQTPFLSFIGLKQIDFTPLAKVGYLFVDMMVLMSGFLLFLPLMRLVVMGEPISSWKEYARRRVARILPSYLFAVLLIFFLFALPQHSYSNTGDAIRDLVTHLTFTQTLFVKTYIGTKCDVVLWTVAIEVWSYVLFPLIATLIRPSKKLESRRAKTISYICIAAVFVIFHLISIWWEHTYVRRPGIYVSMYINQLPAFMGAYANGMLASLIFVLIAKYFRRGWVLAVVGTVLSVLSIVYIVSMVNECAKLQAADAQFWQVSERARLTAAFSIFILSTALAAKWYRFIFSNPLMRFLAGISYNLYIWHQWHAVQIKYEWRIPTWEGTTPPNQSFDRPWMNSYALIITVAAFAAAIIATYLIEKPFANLILGRPMFPLGSKKGLNTKKAVKSGKRK